MAEETTTPEATAAAPAIETAPLKGLLGTKIGMTRIPLDNTRMVPVTVVDAGGIVVTQVKSADKHGYNAVQVGYEDVVERKLSKAEAQHLLKQKLPLKRWLHEFLVKDTAPFKVGQPVPVSVFAKGDWVQVSGMTKGKGYAGVIKRHGFAGLPHSHGNGEYRASPGSSGAQGPQHVLPGTKKPGHMGHIWSTVPKMEVVDIDQEKGLVLLRGSIPGPNGNHVVIRPTSKHVKAKAKTEAKKKKK
jgi:large subunit ribosomal protein L3